MLRFWAGTIWIYPVVLGIWDAILGYVMSHARGILGHRTSYLAALFYRGALDFYILLNLS